MKVVFCGSGSFAVPSLKALLASAHEVVGIITQPARPAGRGGHLRPTPVTQAAEQAGRQAIQCPDINSLEGVETVAGLGGEVIAVADFGQLIRRPVRKLPPAGAFNLHASLLPELRGAAPINWAIIRGYKTTGVTSFRLVAQMDAGDIYLQQAAPIDPAETAEELRSRLAEIGAAVMVQTVDLLVGGQARPRKQDESKATLAPLLSKSDGLLDWSADAETIRNRVHGTWPWPGARTCLRRGDGREVDVLLARALVADGPARGPAGQIDGEGAVATGSGRLRILEIQPAGKRVMTWRDFVNGYRAKEGEAFISVGR